ncbi:MAG: hypothetical protein GF315_14615, partial [candidate division Zixibacteria bacterium]|nr:hypothetical protein [candidate division Zixibacteria bacterium]
MNYLLRIIIVIGFVLIGINGNAAIINVPDDYSTIQEAINNSINGDTIRVAPDEYFENINFNGHNVTVASWFIDMGDTSYISSTIVNGDNSGTVFVFENGENNVAHLIGFTIINGSADSGGGIRCVNSSPVISNNVIKQNYSNRGGGGIYAANNSAAIITSNIVKENDCYHSSS